MKRGKSEEGNQIRSCGTHGRRDSGQFGPSGKGDATRARRNESV